MFESHVREISDEPDILFTSHYMCPRNIFKEPSFTADTDCNVQVYVSSTEQQPSQYFACMITYVLSNIYLMCHNIILILCTV